jgi:copper chaperone CopZ
MQIDVIHVTAMSTPGRASRVARALRAVPGVGQAGVSLLRVDALIELDATLCSPELLRKAVEVAGYGVEGAHRARGRASAHA